MQYNTSYLTKTIISLENAADCKSIVVVVLLVQKVFLAIQAICLVIVLLM